MVLVIKKGAGKKELEALDKKLKASSTKGFDAQKFNGALKIKGNALSIQKKLRNEWNRNIG